MHANRQPSARSAWLSRPLVGPLVPIPTTGTLRLRGVEHEAGSYAHGVGGSERRGHCSCRGSKPNLEVIGCGASPRRLAPHRLAGASTIEPK